MTGRRSHRSACPPLKWVHRARDSFPVGISSVPATRILLRHRPKHAKCRSAIERGRVLFEMLRQEFAAQCAHRHGIGEGDIELTVPINGISVEVAGADRRPDIINDHELGMHQHLARLVPAWHCREEGAQTAMNVRHRIRSSGPGLAGVQVSFSRPPQPRSHRQPPLRADGCCDSRCSISRGLPCA